MTDAEDQDETHDLSKMVESGADLVGGLTGAAIGLIVAGPPGALAGAATGPVVSGVLQSVGIEVKERWLSRRERKRIGGVLGIAAESCQQRIDAGAAIRADDFFDGNESSDAASVVEQTLIAARDETEEKKVAILGRLIAGICVDASISKEQAHLLISTVERLSYRQLNLLLLFASPNHLAGIRDVNYAGLNKFSPELIGLLSEIHDLVREGLLANGGTIALQFVDLIPAQIRTQGVGAQIHNVAQLGLHPDYPALTRISPLLAAFADPATVSV